MVNVCLLPSKGGIGDHHYFIVDFSSVSLICDVFPCVIAPTSRNLHCYSERIRDNYNKELRGLADQHQLPKPVSRYTAGNRTCGKVGGRSLTEIVCS